MNILHEPPKAVALEPAQRFVLGGVSWDEYEKFLEAVGERHVRVTYNRGTLELMTLSPLHELYKNLFDRVLFVLMDELDIPMRALGSTTFRSRAAERGLEPDQCYYLASCARVRNWLTLDLAVDPPPDLALEVDISTSCLDRLAVYAGLRVPEVWRLRGEQIEVHRLRSGGGYDVREDSVELPFVPVQEIPALLRQGIDCQDDRPWLRAVREWVRTRVAPRRQAPAASPPIPPADAPGGAEGQDS